MNPFVRLLNFYAIFIMLISSLAAFAQEAPPSNPVPDVASRWAQDWEHYKIPSHVGFGFGGGGKGTFGMNFSTRFKIIGMDYMYSPTAGDSEGNGVIPHGDYSRGDRGTSGYSIHGYLPLNPTKTFAVSIGKAWYSDIYTAVSNVTGWSWQGGGVQPYPAVTSYGLTWSTKLPKTKYQGGQTQWGGAIEVRYDEVRGVSVAACATF